MEQRNKIALILSLVAVVLSCFAAFGKKWDIDNPSFPLGVLSLLVTILIGWQIFTALGIKKEIKDATERMREENQVLNSRLDAFEKAANKKIDKLKSEQGILKLSHSSIELNKECGRAYFTIDSNTNWNIFVNNTAKSESVRDLIVYPLNGSGNATITVEYGAVVTQNYNEHAVLAVFYQSYGTKQTASVTLYRRHLPD